MGLAMNTTQDSYSLVSGHQSSQAPPIHIWHEDHILVEPPAGQRDVIVILAFISGASFVSLIIILSFFAFCRWRSLSLDDDNASTRSIIYNIEQDKVSISPMVEKHMQNILLLDDITGLLPPSLTALRSAHAITCGIAMRKIVIRNVRDLETLQKAIKHIPTLLDATMEALVETIIKPAEVEARMVALCIGVEQLVGLVQLLDNHKQVEGMKEHLRIMERQLEIIKRRADMWKTDRDTDEHV